VKCEKPAEVEGVKPKQLLRF